MEFAEIALKGALNPKVHKSRWQLDEVEKIGVVISSSYDEAARALRHTCSGTRPQSS